MKKTRLGLFSMTALAACLTSFAQIGTNWTKIEWAGPTESPTIGRRDVHLERKGDKDFNPWENQSAIRYFNGLTSTTERAGSYEYIKARNLEIFSQYGDSTRSVNRAEIRIKDDYNSGQIRQLEGYVKFNEKLGADQSLTQIWGYEDVGAAILLIHANNGVLYPQGRLLPRILNPNFPSENFTNKEFKLNVIHRQETQNNGSITSNGRVEVYVNGILFVTLIDNHISDKPGVPYGGNYMKYGCYGDVDAGGSVVEWKDATYWQGGGFPGTTRQTLTFPAVAPIPLNSPDVAPAAFTRRDSDNALTGLAVSYRSDDPRVAIIVGGKIRPVGVGSAKIWAYQNGTSSYAPSPVAVQTISVIDAVTSGVKINDRTTGTGLNQFEYFAVGTPWKVTSGQVGNFADDFTESGTAGDYVQVRFTGTKIALYGKKKSDGGIAGVSIDGAPEVNADFYAPTEIKMAKIWESQLLPYGTHLLKVRMKNVKNAASSGYLCRVDFVEVKNDSTLTYDSIFREAEGGTLTSPMTALNDVNASAGRYITVASGTGSNATPPAAGSSVVSFTTTGSGTYNIWARTLMPTTAKNSFWIKVDNNPWFSWNDDTALASGWQWNQITSLTLSPGAHTLTIAYREIGAQMDQVLITNDPTFSW